MNQRKSITILDYNDSNYWKKYEKLRLDIQNFDDKPFTRKRSAKSFDSIRFRESMINPVSLNFNRLPINIDPYNMNCFENQQCCLGKDKPKLLAAMDKNDIENIKLLLENIDHYNETDKCGMTALHYACTCDDKIEILCLLLAASGILRLQYKDEFNEMIIICNRNVKDIFNRTPFIIAAQNKAELTIELLCYDINVDKNTQNNEGYTALHIACSEKYKNINIVSTLLNFVGVGKNQISLVKKDNKNNTAFMLTLEYIDRDIWAIFFKKMDINRDTDIRKLNKIFDFNFLKKIIETCNEEFMKFLIENLGEIIVRKILTKTDKDNMKIIHHAINYLAINMDVLKIIKYFLRCGDEITDVIKFIMVIPNENQLYSTVFKPLKIKIYNFLKINIQSNSKRKQKKIIIKAKHWRNLLLNYSHNDEEILNLLI